MGRGLRTLTQRTELADAVEAEKFGGFVKFYAKITPREGSNNCDDKEYVRHQVRSKRELPVFENRSVRKWPTQPSQARNPNERGVKHRRPGYTQRSPRGTRRNGGRRADTTVQKMAFLIQRAVLRASSATLYRFIQEEPRFWIQTLVTNDVDQSALEYYLARTSNRKLDISFQWTNDEESWCKHSWGRASADEESGSEDESDSYVSESEGGWATQGAMEQVTAMRQQLERASTLSIATEDTETLLAMRTLSRELTTPELKRLCIRLHYTERDADNYRDEHPLDAHSWFKDDVWPNILDLHLAGVALPFTKIRTDSLRTLCMVGTGNWGETAIEEYAAVIQGSLNLRHLTLVNVQCAGPANRSEWKTITSTSIRALHVGMGGSSRATGRLSACLDFPQLEQMRVRIVSKHDVTDIKRCHGLLRNIRSLEIDDTGRCYPDSGDIFALCPAVEDLNMHGAAAGLLEALTTTSSLACADGATMLPQLKRLQLGPVKFNAVEAYLRTRDEEVQLDILRIQRTRPAGGIPVTWYKSYQWIAAHTKKVVMHADRYEEDFEVVNLAQWRRD
ncbi:hypothetical protein DFH06DRAFT_1142103 [Mycena polygramma]|nr:hypothetical protein DFH06DRAFT_1142103 [Mycena polygramma]